VAFHHHNGGRPILTRTHALWGSTGQHGRHRIRVYRGVRVSLLVAAHARGGTIHWGSGSWALRDGCGSLGCLFQLDVRGGVLLSRVLLWVGRLDGVWGKGRWESNRIEVARLSTLSLRKFHVNPSHLTDLTLPTYIAAVDLLPHMWKYSHRERWRVSTTDRFLTHHILFSLTRVDQCAWEYIDGHLAWVFCVAVGSWRMRSTV
jgi:hypothetical protein